MYYTLTVLILCALKAVHHCLCHMLVLKGLHGLKVYAHVHPCNNDKRSTAPRSTQTLQSSAGQDEVQTSSMVFVSSFSWLFHGTGTGLRNLQAFLYTCRDQFSTHCSWAPRHRDVPSKPSAAKRLSVPESSAPAANGPPVRGCVVQTQGFYIAFGGLTY